MTVKNCMTYGKSRQEVLTHKGLKIFAVAKDGSYQETNQGELLIAVPASASNKSINNLLPLYCRSVHTAAEAARMIANSFAVGYVLDLN